MKKRLGKAVVTVLVLSGSMALAQDFKSSADIESSCRIKAKEIAANTYRTCVVDQKNSQIEKIKKDYQAKLRALKAHYESELKKMAGGKQSVEKSADRKAMDEPVRSAEENTSVQESERATDRPIDRSIERFDRPEAINSESGESAAVSHSAHSESTHSEPTHSEPTHSESPLSESPLSESPLSESSNEVSVNPEIDQTETSLSESAEKSVPLPKAKPVKKITKPKPTAKKAPVAKKAGVSKTMKSAKAEKHLAKDKVSDMTIRLKQSPRGLIRDASGEMPEPIPVELTPNSSI